MIKDKLNYKLLNFLILAIIVLIVLTTTNYWMWIVVKFISICAPFLLAFAIAYALYPLVKLLKKKGVNNSLAVTLVVVAITFFIAILLAITLPLIYDQFKVLSGMVGEVITDLSKKFDLNLGDFKANLDEVLKNIITSLGKYVTDGTIDILGKSLDFITQFVIVYVVSIYFLAGMENIRLTIKKFFKKKSLKTLGYVKEVDMQLGQYVQGLTLFMLIHLVEYSLLFKIVGHPNWLLLGILAAITTVIPYFGGLITNIIALVLATVVSTKLVIATLIICLIFPQVDGYVISPRVYGKTNNISALWTIFACFAGGALFGIVGVALSLPVYILINCTYKFYEEDIHEKIENITDRD